MCSLGVASVGEGHTAMMTPKKILASGAIGYADYLTAAKRTGDYYVSDNGNPDSAPGSFVGRLAAELGLAGRGVDIETLLMLMDGRDPSTGVRLVRFWARRDRVAGIDCVFSAPSSVSVIWAVADETLRAELDRVQYNATVAAVEHIERTFPLVRRRDATQRGKAIGAVRRRLSRQPTPDEAKRAPSPIVHEPVAALIAAIFSHHTSRQTAYQSAHNIPPDPQPHSHAVFLCMAQRLDGKFVTIDSEPLHRGAREAAAVYRAALSAGYSELGFPIERQTGNGGQYFEIAGVSQALRDAWSSRNHEVEQRAEEWGALMRENLGRDPTPVEKHTWAARGRTRKASYSQYDLFEWWRSQADFHGVTADTIQQLRRSEHRLAPPAEGRAQLIAELLGPSGITREHSAFNMAALRIDAYQRAPGLLAPADVEQALHDLVDHDDVVCVSEGVWTTQEILGMEDDVLAWADTMTAAPKRPVQPDLLRYSLASAPVRLSDEQQDALRHILEHRYTALTGEAGVGKGVVVRVGAQIWKGEGRRVFAIAVSGAQAQRLAADLGDGAEALTFDAFVHRVQAGRIEITDRDVIALDEASQVDSRRWHAFTQAIDQKPTVVLLGDHAQLSSISAGGLWPLLAASGPRLTEVRRTALRWQKDAWAHLRRGEATPALEAYARHGCVDVAPTRREALEHAIAAWDTDRRDGLIITDATNRERHRANRAAQALRHEHGELGPESVHARAAIGPIDLHVGDRIIFVRQHQGDPQERRVENGSTGDIIAVEPARGVVRVRTDEAVSRDIELRVDANCPIDLFYAVHVYKSQGATVRRAYVVAGGWQTHRESLYVAVSRSREATRLFIDRATLGEGADALAELAARATKSRAKVAAVSLRKPIQDLPGHFRHVRARAAKIVARSRAQEQEQKAQAPYEWLFPPGRGWRGNRPGHSHRAYDVKDPSNDQNI